MSRGLNIFVNIGAKLLPSLNSTAGRIERRLGQMNRKLRVQAAETKIAYKEIAAAMKPVVGMAAAGGLSLSLKGTLGKGASYQHELAMLRIAGRTSTEVAEAIAQANKTLRDVPTSTLTDNIKIINETTGAFGNFHHALQNLSFNSKFGYMMTNMLGMDASEVPHALNSAVQALEIRGTAMDSKKYQSDMAALFKAMVFTKGRFNPEELMSFAKTGNIPLKLYDQRFMSRVLPSLITELGGGDIVGTQASAFRNQIMGRVPLGGKKLTEEWVRLGLVPESGTGGNMSKTGWTAGTVKGHALAMSDPFKWIETVMLPAMRDKGGVDINNQEQVLLQLGKMFGRETAMRFVATMADPRQRARLHKDEKMIGQAMPLEDSYKMLLATDPNAAWAKVMAKIDRLATVLGEKVFTEKTLKAIDRFGNAIDSLAGWFDKSPTASRGAVGAMGIGAGMGVLSLMGVSFKWIRTAFVGLSRMLLGAFGGMLVRLAPLLLNGLAALAPWLLRGIGLLFGVVTGPVGWALLAASAVSLVWAYRDNIAAAWHVVSDWFVGAWQRIKNYALTIDWSGIGLRIANSLTGGLVGSGLAIGAKIGSALMGSKPLPGRARGGSVSGGSAYMVGERGPEPFIPGRSGTIIPHHVWRGMAANDRGGNTYNVTIHAPGGNPVEIERAVDRAIRRFGARQSANLSD